MGAIKFIETCPTIRIQADGVSGETRSNDQVMPWRCTRSLWRQFLETEIRRLNDFEAEERKLARGKVLPFREVVGGH